MILRIIFGTSLILLIACTSGETSNEKIQVAFKAEKRKSSSSRMLDKDQLSKKIKGSILYSKQHCSKGKEYIEVLSLERNSRLETGSIYVYQFEWNDNKLNRHWIYADSINCDEADLVLSYDLDSLVVSDIDGDAINETLIVYTLNCTYDVSPQRRYLVLLDHNGKVKLKLKGWTRDLSSKTKFSEIDLRYNPSTDDYNPNSPEGKIENFDTLKTYNSETIKKILAFWEQAFKKDERNHPLNH